SRLGLFAVSDIDSHYGKESRGAIRRTNDKATDIGPDGPAVLATVALFNAIATPCTSDDLIHMLQQPGPIVLVGNLQRRQISQLSLGIAGHQLEALVRRHIPPVLRTEGNNADCSRLEHSPPTLFARAQSRLRPFTVSDVPANAAVADEASRLVKYRQPR